MGGRIGFPFTLIYHPTLEYYAFWKNCVLITLIIRELKNDARGRRDAMHCVSTAVFNLNLWFRNS